MPSAEVPYPEPLTTPAPWLALVDAGEEGTSEPAPMPFPGEHWPDLHAVEYTTKLIVLIVLLLALPWLISKLLTNPGEVMRHSGSIPAGA